MAEKEEKWPENILGNFMDEQCIDCDLCRETAPDFFTRNEEGVIHMFLNSRTVKRRLIYVLKP